MQTTRHITRFSLRLPSDANAMTTKGNVVLYLDKDIVEQSKELGFNLSRTFENHLKQLILQRTNNQSTQNHVTEKWWAEPDSDRRPSARQAISHLKSKHFKRHPKTRTFQELKHVPGNETTESHLKQLFVICFPILASLRSVVKIFEVAYEVLEGNSHKRLILEPY